MTVVAIIPARGGSKRVPRKNVLPIGGRPLVAHSVAHAVEAQSIDEVVVSTDDPEVAAIARGAGARVVDRPAELAGDEATSESALLHALDELDADPELVVFLQATSPARRAGEVDAAVELLRSSGADSVFSATEDAAFLWEERDGGLESVTYDWRARRREQDLPALWRENGSIYVCRTPLLRETGNRLGGRVEVFPMGFWSSFQLDRPEDAQLLDWILARPEYRPRAVWPERIELLVLDFDGVLTDDTVTVHASGDETVSVYRGDGLGLERLREAGVPAFVLSKERHAVVAARCEKLRVPYAQSVDDKAAFLSEHLADRGIDPVFVAYLGNDVNDVDAMRLVGLPVAVADAAVEARAAARLVLSRRGGRGAVRELCDLILERVAVRSASGQP